jgi:MOSC domain-containing protein YiiM
MGGQLSGVVVGLFTATRQGAPMAGHARVDVVPGAGIPGDRYATGRGHWSDPRWPDQELTFIAAEVAEGLGIDAGLLRRNVVTRGVDLETLIGVTFQVGSAVLRGVRRCDPCRYLDGLTRPGVSRELGRRGGLRASVLVAGSISIGDCLAISAPVAASIEPAALSGRQPSGGDS